MSWLSIRERTNNYYDECVPANKLLLKIFVIKISPEAGDLPGSCHWAALSVIELPAVLHCESKDKNKNKCLSFLCRICQKASVERWTSLLVYEMMMSSVGDVFWANMLLTVSLLSLWSLVKRVKPKLIMIYDTWIQISLRFLTHSSGQSFCMSSSLS